MKLWGGRFENQTDKAAFDFQSSIHVDRRLYREDILGSIAHAKTLNRCGVLTEDETVKVEMSLNEMLQDIEDGKLQIGMEHEDIHTFIEATLTERIGDLGKKIHTGRSRNDQVATDFRMYLGTEVDLLVELLKNLEEALISIAEDNLDTILSGYTHLQKAQPLTLAHYLMAYFEMFRRDMERLLDAKKRIMIMPLGSGALAGTTFDLDREYTCQLLGFNDITYNSLDGVSDRDFAIELASDLSIIMMHLSRFCEEIILWASGEFGYVEMDDGFSTGSSIMPQKKNPDVAELIRGKTGRVYGSNMTLLTIMKSLPLAYNKDMQEDKEAVFDAIDTVKACVDMFTGMIKTIRFNKDRMYEASEEGYTNATDLADYLVKKGVPFRETHEISGQIVNFAIKQNKKLSEITVENFKRFSDLIEEDIYREISVETCVNARNLIGGPAREAVMKAIERGKEFLNEEMGDVKK
ncbi:argininosuccinate lyase [Gudongella sp. DL1XJH-153]|uniref:argininosuccinate lyase n=1 Tax=Gudongella sp. DL1XJH-153 TaxID=3409804 RepID=UPI003BB7945F